MEFKLGELFCGPGGIALGAKNSIVTNKNEEYRITHAWANDFDEATCRTYRHNICPSEPDSVIHEDVRKLNLKSLSDIDGFAFGFPCNDFSLVGEKKGFEGDFGPLYSYGVEVLNEQQPKWFVAENVGGLSSSNEGSAFIKILEDLKNAGKGYKITPHLYKFEEYGVPQARHRIIIVGIREDIKVNFKVPAPSGEFKTASDAIDSPPIPNDAHNHEFTKHKQHVIDMLNYIPPGENAWYEGIPEHMRLKVKKTRMSQIYKRLNPDKPAYTVTGSGGGGTHMYHYSEPRALTNRERARLQTFPDDFEFLGSKESVRKQIGMAVPPKGAEVIFRAILNTFAGIEYESVSPKWEMELREVLSAPVVKQIEMKI
ncbi:cytosine-specific methyltransferase [Halobacillus andaensis]|uniref:Cytosine-specific methyltransferase n=1 Tax=Halobacillus andaensis TaxID=1176239 RepID=A0A917B1W0_HALAA|nr:DNA cytosine methyltransferase [Halobacillus andaensis]MBP2004913.1 DNA (cytosine-5)-methyltransferase 1 [Halobacillus andaensis]GGF17926.1 cytosine-specific methyltransferase [Halobacillus andaensis]